jgi:hypothetical protein
MSPTPRRCERRGDDEGRHIAAGKGHVDVEHFAIGLGLKVEFLRGQDPSCRIARGGDLGGAGGDQAPKPGDIGLERQVISLAGIGQVDGDIGNADTAEADRVFGLGIDWRCLNGARQRCSAGQCGAKVIKTGKLQS